jgi:hypothetical protein
VTAGLQAPVEDADGGSEGGGSEVYGSECSIAVNLNALKYYEEGLQSEEEGRREDVGGGSRRAWGGEWPIMLTLLVSFTSRLGQICFASVLWQVLTVTLICINYALHEYSGHIQFCKALKTPCPISSVPSQW